jgi:hypothetical protein
MKCLYFEYYWINNVTVGLGSTLLYTLLPTVNLRVCQLVA